MYLWPTLQLINIFRKWGFKASQSLCMFNYSINAFGLFKWFIDSKKCMKYHQTYLFKHVEINCSEDGCMYYCVSSLLCQHLSTQFHFEHDQKTTTRDGLIRLNLLGFVNVSSHFFL